MAKATVIHLPDEVRRALRERAARHGRRAGDEIVKTPERLLPGMALAEVGRRAGLTNEEFAAVELVRDTTPAEPMRFD